MPGPQTVEQLYATIHQEISPEAEVLARQLIMAFAMGLGSEPMGMVDLRAADDRTRDYLVAQVTDEDTLRFSFDEERHGFLYYDEKIGGDRVLAQPFLLAEYDMVKHDPLMPYVIQLALIYHREVAQQRGKVAWFPQNSVSVDHYQNIVRGLGSMSHRVYSALAGLADEMPRID